MRSQLHPFKPGMLQSLAATFVLVAISATHGADPVPKENDRSWARDLGFSNSQVDKFDARALRLISNVLPEAGFKGLNNLPADKPSMPLLVITDEDLGSDLQKGDLRSVAQIPRIVGVSLNDLEDIGELEALRGLKQIRLISLYRASGDPDVFAKLVASLSELQSLEIRSSDPGQSFLFANENLMKALSKCKKLKQLTLDDVRCPHGGLQYLVDLPNLKEVEIDSAELDEEGERRIKKSKSIESLLLRRRVRTR